MLTKNKTLAIITLTWQPFKIQKHKMTPTYFFYKKILLFKRLLLLFFLQYAVIISTGFSAETLVKTPLGYKAIKDLKQNEFVVCYDYLSNQQKNRTITNIRKITTSQCLKTQLLDQSIITDLSQQFYFPSIKKWLTILAAIKKQLLPLDAKLFSLKKTNENVELYEITIEEFHNFYITSRDILVHNNIATLVLTIGQQTVVPALTKIGCGILAGLGISRFNKKQKNYPQSSNLQPTFPNNLFPENGPREPQENNFFEKIKLIADKIVRSNKFGKFYRDPNTKLWWSKDRANHGGSAFKVFREQAKGLEWIYDADVFGNPILQKNKGPIGTFISFKDLITCI